MVIIAIEIGSDPSPAKPLGTDEPLGSREKATSITDDLSPTTNVGTEQTFSSHYSNAATKCSRRPPLASVVPKPHAGDFELKSLATIRTESGVYRHLISFSRPDRNPTNFSNGPPGLQ